MTYRRKKVLRVQERQHSARQELVFHGRTSLVAVAPYNPGVSAAASGCSDALALEL